MIDFNDEDVVGYWVKSFSVVDFVSIYEVLYLFNYLVRCDVGRFVNDEDVRLESIYWS